MARRQLGAAYLNDQGRKKLLEDEIRKWLARMAATSPLTNTPEWENTDGMLVAKLKVAGPSLANDPTGHRSALPLHIFEANAKPLFPSSETAYQHHRL